MAGPLKLARSDRLVLTVRLAGSVGPASSSSTAAGWTDDDVVGLFGIIGALLQSAPVRASRCGKDQLHMTMLEARHRVSVV